EHVGSSTLQMFTFIGSREPENVYGLLVTTGCFQALGAPPLMGRLFAESDFTPAAPDVAVLSYKLWQSSLAGDPSILGRTLLLNGKAHTVIGIMRPEFQYRYPVFGIWAPWKLAADSLSNHVAHPYTLVARLKPGVTPQAAQADLEALAQSLAR